MAVSFSRYWLFSIADTLQQTHTHTQGNRSSRFRWLSSRFDYTYTIIQYIQRVHSHHTHTHTLHTGCVELLPKDALPCYFVYFGFSLSQVWKIRKVLSLCSQCHHPCSVFDFISLPIVCVEYRASLYAVLLLLNSCLFLKFFVSWFYSPWFWRMKTLGVAKKKSSYINAKNFWIFSSFFSPAILGVSFCFCPLSQTHEKKKLFNIIMCVCMYSFERCFIAP